jgi:hypothetical protein
MELQRLYLAPCDDNIINIIIAELDAPPEALP